MDMTTHEEINALVLAHGFHASAPTLISSASQLLDMDYPGVVVVGDSVDVFNHRPPGAPTDALVCYPVDNVSRMLDGILETRRADGKRTVVMVARADDEQARRSLGEDLAASAHMKCES